MRVAVPIPLFLPYKSYDEFSDTYVLQEVRRGTDALGDPDQRRDGQFRIYLEGGLTYARTFNDLHDVSGLLIYTQEEIKNTSGNPGRIQQTLPQRLQGMRARVNYGFDNRYLVEMSLTYTGSEKFARDHRWGVFPRWAWVTCFKRSLLG